MNILVSMMIQKVEVMINRLEVQLGQGEIVPARQTVANLKAQLEKIKGWLK